MGPCDDTRQRLTDTCTTLKSKLASVATAVRALDGDDRAKAACAEDAERAARDIEALARIVSDVLWRYDTMLEMMTHMTGMKNVKI